MTEAPIPIREQHRNLTRSEILAAAADLFRTGRYHDLSVDSIAKRAGVSRATFYLHFANKREVLDELLTPLRDASTELWEHVQPTSGSAAAIAPHVERFLGAVTLHEGAFRAWMQAGAAGEDVAATSRRDLDRVRRLVFAGTKGDDTAALARSVALVSVLERFCVYWLDHELPIDPATAADTISAAMWPLLDLAPAPKRG